MQDGLRDSLKRYIGELGEKADQLRKSSEILNRHPNAPVGYFNSGRESAYLEMIANLNEMLGKEEGPKG